MKILHHIFKKSQLWLMLTTLFIGLALASCQDKVDESDLYTFTGSTAYSYLTKHDSLSDFAYLMSRVKLSSKSSSTVAQLLSARGNYTVFAPTNDAIQHYLDSVNLTTGYDITQTSDSVAQFIVMNSIIDNGSSSAYKTSDFNGTTLDKTNMYDRYITISYDTLTGGQLAIRISNFSKIIKADIEVENGIVHEVNHILDLSYNVLPTLLDNTPNMRIFAHLLKITGWADSMQKYRDLKYEDTRPNYGPERRYYGYTAFVEPDSIYETQWGVPAPVLVNNVVTNWDDIVSKIEEEAAKTYTDATSSNVTSMENALNQFVAYHLLPERITYSKLVIHDVEMGYGWATPNILSIDCFDYYETMGNHRRLIKLTDGVQTEGKRINRYCTYNFKDYSEKMVYRKGILISEDNGTYKSNSLNGFYFPISEILLYDQDVPNKVLDERIRFNIPSVPREMMTMDYRAGGGVSRFPPNYLTGVWFSDETEFGYGRNSMDYRADCFTLRGQYDMIIKLPPVPREGTYEVRWAVPMCQNDNRGMCQLYFGKNKNNLPPMGLPLDQRLWLTDPVIGWHQDTDDPILNEEYDKILRNHGYIKPPMHDGVDNDGAPVVENLRNQTAWPQHDRLRRIVWTGTMKPSDVYYVRIKNALDNTSTLTLVDYMEFCPKHVFSGTEAEDKW